MQLCDGELCLAIAYRRYKIIYIMKTNHERENTMKKIITLILALVMIAMTLVLASCGETKKVLNVYTESGFPPYEYLSDKGDVVGVDIDTITYIGEQLGYEVRINDIDFDLIFNEIEKNELAVGVAGITKKPDRDAVANASAVYATSVQYVIAPNGTFSGEKITVDEIIACAASQNGKAIGAQKATTGFYLVDDFCAENPDCGVSAIEYSNAIIAVGDIGSSISAVVVDKLPAEAISADNDGLECWAIDAEPESYVMYFNKNATELLQQVNEILEQMIKDGKIDEFTVNHSK